MANTNISRRNFLKTSALTGLGASLVGLADPGSAPAAEAPAPIGGAPPPARGGRSPRARRPPDRGGGPPPPGSGGHPAAGGRQVPGARARLQAARAGERGGHRPP